MQPAEVGVYGLGRFGTFFSALLARHLPVVACSRSPDRAAPPRVRLGDEREVASRPAVILCVAISAVPEVLRRIAVHLLPGALVMDTCSVKVAPVQWMREILPAHVDILATHPMFGPDSARGGVQGLPMVLAPVRIREERLQWWESFFGSLGLEVQRMDPHFHDREAAFTQGLTHFIGRVLAELHLRPSAIASVGYRRLLEIVEQTCNDSWQLFLDLQRINPYTRQMRRVLNQALAAVNERLDEGGEEGAPGEAGPAP